MKKSKILISIIFILLLISFFDNSFDYAQNKKIIATLDHIIYKSQGQEELGKEYTRITEVELEIIQPPRSAYCEKLEKNLLSNNMPNIIEIPNYALYESYAPGKSFSYTKLASDKILTPLNSYINNSKVLKQISSEIFDALKIKEKIYGFPIDRGLGYVTYIRKDWLDNLEMAVPTTWDELYKVMLAFTYCDPDKNGKHDTIGYTFPRFETVYLADFYQGATNDFDFVDCQWVDGFTRSNFKNSLLRLKRAYEDQTIEFTNRATNSRENFAIGRAGIFCYLAGAWGKNLDDWVKANSIDSNAKVIAIPCINGSNYWRRIDSVLAITEATKDPEFVFKNIIELMNDGGVGQMLFTHGVEGLHYSTNNGKYIKKNIGNSNVPFSHVYIRPEQVLIPWNDPFPMDERIKESIQVLRDKSKYIKIKPYSETYFLYGNDILKLKEDIMNKIVTGELEIDEGLNLYKKRAKELKVEQILKEFNENM